MDISPGQVVGGFRIEEEIGRGGFAAVYKAVNEITDEVVALKVPFDEFVDNFKQESLAGKLKHSNIVRFLAGDLNSQPPYIAMEYLETSLQEKIEQLSPEQSGQIISGVLDAMIHAEEYGIVHKDIKPSNILLTPDNQPRVSDFGLCERVDELEMSFERTQAKVSGSVDYIAPEVMDGQAADSRSDIFSMGSLIYEISTKRKPRGTLKSTGNPKLDDLIKKCREFEPQDRFQSFRELKNEFDNIFQKDSNVSQILEVFPAYHEYLRDKERLNETSAPENKQLVWKKRLESLGPTIATAVSLALLVGVGYNIFAPNIESTLTEYFIRKKMDLPHAPSKKSSVNKNESEDNQKNNNTNNQRIDYLSIARTSLNHSQLYEARNAVREVLKKNPSNAEAQNMQRTVENLIRNYRNVYENALQNVRQNRLYEARSGLEQALRLYPGSQEAIANKQTVDHNINAYRDHYNRAMDEFNQGQLVRALGSADMALQVYPSSNEAQNLFSRIKRSARNDPRAQEFLRQLERIKRR